MYLTDIASLRTFNTEFSTFESWLEKSSLYLEDSSKCDITDNISETGHKLDEIRSFSQELDKAKPQMEVLRTSVNGMLEKSEANFASLLSSRLETMAYRYNVIVNKSKNLSDKYEGALKKNDDVSIRYLHKA
jgi:chaperonin cofactor prefoldin